MKNTLPILAFLVLFGLFAAWQIQTAPPTVQEEGYVDLFNGYSLDGWYKVGGESSYRVINGEIVGTNGPGANTFLRTERSYADFVLKMQMRWDEPGNSGVMFRGKQKGGNGRVYGYQYELDHSERAWSGGIYDEARRGWLSNLEDNAAARAAIKLDDWNDVRIEAHGASLKTWINDVPAADIVDAMDASGFIALQVHSGDIGVMRWRNIRLRELPAVTAEGAPLDDEQEWQARNIEDWEITPRLLRGRAAAAARITARRQFADFSLRFTIPVCNDPQRIRFRELSESADTASYAELTLNATEASVSINTAEGAHGSDVLSFANPASSREVLIVALGNAVTVSVDGRDVMRWRGDGLSDRGRLSLEPVNCAGAFALAEPAWEDPAAGEQETLFYQTLDNKPAPVLTPEQALADFQLAPGFEVELVAAEPLVDAPVAMAWDEYARLYVVEMRGFMPDAYGTGQEEPVGRIVRLVDEDQDGRMDTSTVFLDGLVNPRAVAVSNAGILVGEPPNLWLCTLASPASLCDNKQRLGDYGLAEEGTSVEHLENALLPGLDNWFYNAKSARKLRLRDGVLQQQESLARGQWGISKDNFGRLLYNHNSNFITADFFAAEDLVDPGIFAEHAGLGVVLTAPEEVFSGRVNPGVNRAYLDHTLREDGRLYQATAVSGLAAYRGDQFPPEYRQDVFVPEPGANVVAQFRLTETGLALSAEHVLYDDAAWGQREFMTATDERFRPVDARVGPDGALYIIDMYRGIIQEQHFLTDELREQIFQRGLDKPLGHGRIWRIRHTQGKPDRSVPKLASATGKQLVAALADGNGWVRDTAQRLLLKLAGDAGAELQAALTADSTLAAIHALWTLQGRGELSREMTLATLGTNDEPRQIQALRAGRAQLSSADLVAFYQDGAPPGAAARMQLAFALGDHVKDATARAVLRQLLTEDLADPYVAQAVVRSTRGAELDFLQELFAQAEMQTESAGGNDALIALSQSAYRTLRGPLDSADPAPAALSGLLELVVQQDGAQQWRQLALLKGLHKLSTVSGFVPAHLDAAPALFADSSIDEDSPLWDARLQGRRAYTWPGDELAAGIVPLSPSQIALMQKGEKFYAGCATCHGPTGAGVAGLAPALANAPWVLGPPEWLGRIVLQGMNGPVEIDGKVWNGVMPPHVQHPGLDDATLAGLMTFLRRSWGHTEDPVSVQQAAAIRELSSARTLPWTVPELEQVPVDRGYGKFVGEYKVSFITMTVFEEDGQLHMKVPMYGGGVLESESDTVFTSSAGGQSVKLEFVLEEDGAVNQLLMYRDGQKIPVLKVQD